MAYKLVFSNVYKVKYQKIIKRNANLRGKIIKVHELLSIDPQNPALKSHKVNAINFGLAWSSSVTGDIRIIWNYDEQNKLVILILTIGSHSGSSKVYK